MNQNSSIIGQNDNLVSKIVKRRDPFCRLNVSGICTGQSKDPAHVFGRTNMATRWKLLAVYGGCRECHSYIDTHPKEKKRLFMLLMGWKYYNKLEFESNTNKKYLPTELREIRKNLRFELANQSQVC